MVFDSKRSRCVALWIKINHQNPEALGCKGCGNVNRGRGFTDTALLVRNCDDSGLCRRSQPGGFNSLSTLSIESDFP